MDRAPPVDIEPMEVDLLLEAVYRRYGYDFRCYARASIERRVRQFMAGTRCRVVSEMIPLVLHDPEFSTRLVRYFSIPVTEMFRDPFVFQALRGKVLPLLRTWPHVKIWVAGCASGQEVYSLAILLKEEGLLDRATIYATDFNEEALDRARAGIYPIEKIKDASQNYQQAGGKASLAEYFHAAYDSVVMSASLRERIVF